MAKSHKHRDHAILSASGASRWIKCSPSARLEEKIESTSNDEADEGTLAHELSELLLKFKLGWIAEKIYKRDLASIKENKFYNRAMWRHCNDFAAYVLERYAEAQTISEDAVILLETRFDLSYYIPEGFGTVDVVIICDEWILVIDLKYGKGVLVDAVDNTQLKIYAIGAVRDYEVAYDFTTVETVIFQPRLDNISPYKLELKKLVSWAENTLKPAAKTAFAGTGEYVPGSHCQFCKVKVRCKALASYNNEIQKYKFLDPALLSNSEIAEILGKLDLLKNWANAVAEFALKDAVNNGTSWPGYKIVAGRSNRKYIEKYFNKIINKLVSLGYDEEDILKPEALLPITEMVKTIGEKDFNKHLLPFIIKEPGKPALVPLTDKRHALNSNEAARLKFADHIEDNGDE